MIHRRPPGHASRSNEASKHPAVASLIALASCVSAEGTGAADGDSTSAAASATAGISTSDVGSTDTAPPGNADATSPSADSEGALEPLSLIHI